MMTRRNGQLKHIKYIRGNFRENVSESRGTIGGKTFNIEKSIVPMFYIEWRKNKFVGVLKYK